MKLPLFGIAIIVVALLALFLVPIKYTAYIGGAMNYTYILIGILVGTICGMVTQSMLTPRGYGDRAAFCIGFFLGPIGVLVAFLMARSGGDEPSESDKARALREYKQLLDDGTISKAEFERKKRELLG